MTQDEMIELAKQAGLCYQVGIFPDWIDAGPSEKEIIAFANLVAAKEREACAEVCDELDIVGVDLGGEPSPAYGYDCAKAIRARGEQP